MAISGLGIGYVESLSHETDEIARWFDFMEVAPESFEGNLVKAQTLKSAIDSRYGVSIHGTELSFASADDQLIDEKLKSYNAIARLFNSPWVSEHLSFHSFENGTVDAYINPPFTMESAQQLGKRQARYSVELDRSFHLENIANFFWNDGACELSEPEFIEEVLNHSGQQLILNLDSLIISAFFARKDPAEFLLEFPCDQVESITIVPSSCANLVIQRKFGESLDKLMLPLLDFALRRTSATSVLIQRRYEHNTIASLAPVASSIREILRKNGR